MIILYQTPFAHLFHLIYSDYNSNNKQAFQNAQLTDWDCHKGARGNYTETVWNKAVFSYCLKSLKVKWRCLTFTRRTCAQVPWSSTSTGDIRKRQCAKILLPSTKKSHSVHRHFQAFVIRGTVLKKGLCYTDKRVNAVHYFYHCLQWNC